MSPRTSWVIRDAEEADLPAIVALYADDVLGAGREQPGLPLDPAYVAAFAAIRADPDERLVVLVEGDEVVATLQLSVLHHVVRRGARRAQLEAVRVASTHRGGGVGRELVTWAIEEARRRGCSVVQLTSDVSRVDARRFYEGLGFTASHVGMKLALPT